MRLMHPYCPRHTPRASPSPQKKHFFFLSPHPSHLASSFSLCLSPLSLVPLVLCLRSLGSIFLRMIFLPFVLGPTLPGLRLPLEIALSWLGTIQTTRISLMLHLYTTSLVTLVPLDCPLPSIAPTQHTSLKIAALTLILVFPLMTLTQPKPNALDCVKKSNASKPNVGSYETS